MAQLKREKEQERAKDVEKRREEKRTRYMAELKEQIEDRKRRTMEQEAWESFAPTAQPFTDGKAIETRNCDSCDKDFPKTQLTRMYD